MSQNLQDILREMVDGILVINLDSSIARYEAFRSGAEGSLPAERVERLSAVAGRELPGFGAHPWFTARTGSRAGSWAGAAGCVLSHRKCIETARERGWKRVLILEDDSVATAADGVVELLRTACSQLQGAYMLYLGHNRPVPYGRRKAACGKAELWQVDGVLATHAYVLPMQAYDILLSLLPTEETVWEWIARHRAIDTFYRECVGEDGVLPVYAVYPLLFTQASGVSDIGGCIVPDNRSICVSRPYPLESFRGWLYRLARPFRLAKYRLNFLRTLIRAELWGFPGPRRHVK